MVKKIQLVIVKSEFKKYKFDHAVCQSEISVILFVVNIDDIVIAESGNRGTWELNGLISRHGTLDNWNISLE